LPQAGLRAAPQGALLRDESSAPPA
jgi:hypothetical protein